MNILYELSTLFCRGTYHEQPLPPVDRSYDLGVKAGEIEMRRNLNMPRDIYSFHSQQADKLLGELLEDGSFDYKRFNAGYQTLAYKPYEQAYDVLGLRKRAPEEFALINSGAFEPAISQ